MDLSHFTSAQAMPEFVGTTILDTIGLVIANVDDGLFKKMNYDKNYCSLGFIGSRTGAAGQILAVDEALKAINCEFLSIHLPRDIKGWGGHGSFIVIGSQNVADARRCIEIALDKITLHAGVIADFALKASNVELIQYLTPSIGTSHSNEVIVTLTGDTTAVKESIILARTNGLLLESMGSKAISPTGVPYI